MTFENYKKMVENRYLSLNEVDKEAVRRLVYSDDGKIMQQVLGDELLGGVRFAIPKDNQLDTEA